MDFLLDQGLWVTVAILLGYFLKNKTEFNNQAIPILNLIIQFLGRLVLEISPANAGVALGGLVGSTLLQIFLQAVGTTVFATGAQSGAKATGRVFLQAIKYIAAQKVAKAAQDVADKTLPPK